MKNYKAFNYLLDTYNDYLYLYMIFGDKSDLNMVYIVYQSLIELWEIEFEES